MKQGSNLVLVTRKYLEILNIHASITGKAKSGRERLSLRVKRIEKVSFQLKAVLNNCRKLRQTLTTEFLSDLEYIILSVDGKATVDTDISY